MANDENRRFSMLPDYVEPTTLEQFKQRVASFTPEAPGTIYDVQQLAGDMLERIAQLEAALLPFAVVGMNVAQARMMLDARGKRRTPAGGTWISTMTSTSCTASEHMFWQAIEAAGVETVNAHMRALFDEMQKAADAQDERDDHVDAGGPTH